MAGYRIEKVQFLFLLQQVTFKPTTNNIKPVAGLRPATLVVVGLINNCCGASPCDPCGEFDQQLLRGFALRSLS